MLRPGTNWMRAQITEVLDMDMIRQQADNDAVDIQGLASYIITIMGQMCSQVRDKDIEKLRQSPDNMVTRFKYVLEGNSCLYLINCQSSIIMFVFL